MDTTMRAHTSIRAQTHTCGTGRTTPRHMPRRHAAQPQPCRRCNRTRPTPCPSAAIPQRLPPPPSSRNREQRHAHFAWMEACASTPPRAAATCGARARCRAAASQRRRASQAPQPRAATPAPPPSCAARGPLPSAAERSPRARAVHSRAHRPGGANGAAAAARPIGAPRAACGPCATHRAPPAP